MSVVWTVTLYCTFLLLLNSGAVEVENNVFTVNDVQLRVAPSTEVKNGGRINLTCTVDISQSGHFPIRNLFLFDKEDTLIYNVTSEAKRTTYTISPARVSHSGYYKCAVESNGKKKGSKEMLVKVTGLNRPILNISKNEASEGDSVEVSCEVPEENPPFEFIFFKTNQNQNQPREKRVRKAPNNNYAITTFQVNPGDIILYFECAATIKSVSDPETSDFSARSLVTVTEPFSTPKITVSPSGNITEGKNMTVECTVITSHTMSEDIQLTIQKQKQIVKSAKHGTIVFNERATLDHMGNYTCKAESSRVSKASSLYITVAELFSRPELLATSTQISEGSNLSLECFIEGENQTSVNFFIEKDTRLTIPMKQHGKYSKTAVERDSGLYVCVVTIQNITKRSIPVRIYVYAPVSTPVLTHDRRGSDVVVGQKFSLKCKSSKGTPPIEYSLFRGNETLQRVNVTDNTSAVFQVFAESSHQFVEYRCEAKNKNKAPWRASNALNISAIAPVQNTSLTIIPENGEVEDGNDLTLLCAVNNGSLPVTFTFYHKKQNTNSTLNTTTVHAHSAYWITLGFSQINEGTYFCTSSNKAKMTTISRLVQVKVVLASWKKTIIASCVVALFISISAGLIWLYLQKKKKGKQFALEMARTANSNKAKTSSGQNTAEDPYYVPGHNENGENHTEKFTEEKKGLDETKEDVEYVEVMQETPDPHKAPVKKGTDTVYTEIQRSHQDAGENNAMRIEGSPDAT